MLKNCSTKSWLQVLTLSWIGCTLIATPATAGPFSFNVTNDVYSGVVNGIPTAQDNNDGIPDIKHAINLLQGTTFARNGDVDFLFSEPDEVWTRLSGTAPIALIGLTANNRNTIGVYTDLGTGASLTDVLGPFSGFGFTGDGTASNPFPAAPIGLSPGTQFGWYLHADLSAFYFSEPTLNPAGLDHMMTFALPAARGKTVFIDQGNGAEPLTLSNPFLIAWEDIPFSDGVLGDDDYDDMMYIIRAPRRRGQAARGTLDVIIPLWVKISGYHRSITL